MAPPAVSSNRTYPSHLSSPKFDKGGSRPNKIVVPGGLIWLPPIALLAACIAFLSGVISWPAYRIWWACVEVYARRESARRQGCDLAPLTVAHVMDALGRDARLLRIKVEQHVEDLRLLGLLVLTRGGLHFPDVIEMIQHAGVRASVASWAGELGQRWESRMGVPRRVVTTWRQQARAFRTPVGVTVGVLFRVMMTGRYTDYRGHVKVGWLERFSGGSRRSVKRAVAALVSPTGPFERLDAGQREMQAHGGRYRLKVAEGEALAESCGTLDEVAPHPCEQLDEMAPPCIEPPAPGSPVQKNHCYTVYAGTSDTCQRGLESRPAIEHRKIETDELGQRRQRQSLRSITRSDLRDPVTLQRLFEVAVENGYVKWGDRPAVFALGQHALRVARNPGGLFYAGLVDPAIRQYADHRDEDGAALMIGRLGEPTPAQQSRVNAAYAASGVGPVSSGSEALVAPGKVLGCVPAIELGEVELQALRRLVVERRRAPVGPRRRREIFMELARERFIAACETGGEEVAVEAHCRFVQVWEAACGPAPLHYPWDWGVEWAEQVGELRAAAAGG